MKKIYLIIFIFSLFTVTIVSCTQLFSNESNLESINTIDEKVDILLSKMTLEEKIGQMTQVDRHLPHFICVSTWN